MLAKFIAISQVLTVNGLISAEMPEFFLKIEKEKCKVVVGACKTHCPKQE